MKSVLTNIRLDAKATNNCIKENKSLIGFDFYTDIPQYSVEKSDGDYIIVFKDASINMPDGAYTVDDGIIDKVVLKSFGKNVEATVKLYIESDSHIKISNGIPAKMNFYVDRTPLKNILLDKKIALNLVHKKTTKSPTNLLPQVPMNDIAKKTSELLNLLSAKPFIIGSNYIDSFAINDDVKYDIAINFATEVSLKDESGFKIYYDKQNDKSKRLAEILNKTVKRKSPLNNLGIHAKKYGNEFFEIPIVTVVPAIENSRLDDAHLRDIDYRSKIALAVFNGILEYFKKN
ncbi:N-acetylmuramoyl-L-alanine amidase [Thermoanaerobacterium saccharolyticum]|uniref:N-acetylmuramoyl-L-alanine amidase n=1 Tax=Thermoanaerobacterium saccharolyticum TaxID=28896 RepID=UPI002FD953E0